jgi:hypothetical protein
MDGLQGQGHILLLLLKSMSQSMLLTQFARFLGHMNA